MMLEVMVGVVYMQVDILVNMDVDKVADMVMKIPIEGFTDVTLVQGCTPRCSSRANAGGRATCAELDISFRHIV